MDVRATQQLLKVQNGDDEANCAPFRNPDVPSGI
jgi:hypothetical protein